MKHSCILTRFVGYLLVGFFVSLSQTWFVLNHYENRYATGWPRVFSGAIWNPADPSTTGWMIGEPNADGDFWWIRGDRNDDYRIHIIRHFIFSHQLSGVELDFKSGSIPSWTRISSIPSIDESRKGLWIIEQFSGWPFLAWRGESKVDNSGFVSNAWCFPADRSFGTIVWNQLILFPYEPVFPGVLYNAIFFGGILFITVCIIKHTRRRITDAVRISRHQCTKCKYDIIGLTICPECGQAVER